VAPSPRTGRRTASGSSEPTRRISTGGRLLRHDRRLGHRFVAGADEAGRGCLAGPLVAAGVLLDLERLSRRDVRDLRALNDSKQHDHDAREALYPVVLRVAAKVSVISRSVHSIDTRGLHKMNIAALRAALLKVACPGAILLSDGFPLGDLDGHERRAIVDGDATSAAIAAASIIAKVTRDRYMRRIDALHPGWDFAGHVGYSTPEHRAAIRRLGVSPLHRLSFQSTAYTQLELA
jgi:ribonuclease HII